MFFKNKNSKYILAFVIVLLVSLVYKVVFKGSSLFVNKEDFITEPSSMEASKSETETEIEVTTEGLVEVIKYRVYICGQVNCPGVYEIENNMLLCDVIDMAGGLLEDAPIENINLVYEISGNESIYIPTKEELEEFSYNSEIFRVNHGFKIDENNEETYSDISLESEEIYLIDINNASKEVLMSLPGIGESMADAIISFREGQKFISIEDIMNVPGIGEGKFSKIKDLICVD